MKWSQGEACYIPQTFMHFSQYTFIILINTKKQQHCDVQRNKY